MAAVKATLSTAVCSSVPPSAVHSPAAAASASPGASTPTVQRCRQAVATVSHRQSPRGSRTERCANAHPTPAASSPVTATAVTCAGSTPPCVRMICKTCTAASAMQPASAPMRGRLSASRRTAAVTVTVTASLMPSSTG